VPSPILPAALGVASLVALGRFLNRRRLPRAPADAALVFGRGSEWKSSGRIRTAASIFHRGVVRHLVVSGGVPANGVSEAERFRRGLLAAGVPDGCISLEDRATNTAENCTFSLPILRRHGARSVVLVMSDFEGVRAHLTAQKAWGGEMEIFDCHAPSPGHWSPHGWWLTREGWYWTWHTVSRLFRYGLLPCLWRGSSGRW
jgi:uncharacterized SAM-binding protein YcdF (DUF218 family)